MKSSIDEVGSQRGAVGGGGGTGSMRWGAVELLGWGDDGEGEGPTV